MHPLEAFAGIELPGSEIGSPEGPGRPLVSHLKDQLAPGAGGPDPLVIPAEAVEEMAPDPVLLLHRGVSDPDGSFGRLPVDHVVALQDPRLVVLEKLPPVVAILNQLVLQLVHVQHLPHTFVPLLAI